VQPFNKVKHIQFIGMGGVGMSGIAEVLHNQGFMISGSDLAQSAVMQRMQAMGITCYLGHNEAHVKGADVVVYSSAVSADNPEMIQAKAQRMTIVPRAQMLAELMRFRFGIAIAGTHGKTTTTSLIASVFAHAGLDPTFVIGGLLNSAGCNAKLGEGKYLIAEADESDASFVLLHPMVAVVTNIDQDHMNTYKGDVEQLKQAFLNFMHQVPFYGAVVLCLDDPINRSLLSEISRPLITYGFSEDADIRITQYHQHELTCSFEVLIQGQSHLFHLNIPGRHNALNACAAIAVALEEGISVEKLGQALQKFAGVGRRFQTGRVNLPSCSITLIDDYGHHPNEILAIMNTVREGWPKARLVMVFQPHRYTRTHDLFDQFAEILAKADELLLLDVYPAGEQPIAGATSQELIRAIRQRSHIEPILITDQSSLVSVLDKVCKGDELVVMQGAGSIGRLAASLLEQYGAPDQVKIA
jgi:UDP-N-acetylmuramate--alanine ligase